eukprot:10954406-Alexandrium_andersonii.AAC.1
MPGASNHVGDWNTPAHATQLTPETLDFGTCSHSSAPSHGHCGPSRGRCCGPEFSLRVQRVRARTFPLATTRPEEATEPSNT